MDLTKEDKDLLEQILSSFSCEKDRDIENFLRHRAVQFEELSKSRTYLICDEEQLASDGFYLENLTVYEIKNDPNWERSASMSGPRM